MYVHVHVHVHVRNPESLLVDALYDKLNDVVLFYFLNVLHQLNGFVRFQPGARILPCSVYTE